MKLYESIPITDWKKIAYLIQRLDITKKEDTTEFLENLKKLRKLLEEGKINMTDNEVYLSSLLHAIYNGNCPIEYKKAYFYEKIYMLDELGIESIQFNPELLKKASIKEAFTCSQKEDHYVINRCYTDGTFQLKSNLENPTKYNYSLDLIGLNKAKYVLTSIVKQKKEEKNSFEIVKSEIILANFNGEYPRKSELTGKITPEIKVPYQTIEPYMQPNMIEVFSVFYPNELECKKRLTKTKNGSYYYKEFKNEKKSSN